MIFAKIDVTLAYHQKAHQAGQAMATWAWGLAYTREQELDGFIPAASLRLSWVGEAQAKKDLAKLCDVGLATVDAEREGWRLLKYDAKNETKAAIDARREQDRERKRKAKGFRPDSVRKTSGTGGGIPGSVSSGYGSGYGSLASPVGITLDDALRGWAGMAGAPEPTEDHLAEFQLDAAKHGKVFADPIAAFKSWMLKQKRFDSDRRARASANGKHVVQSAENRAWTPPKDMP